MRDRGQSESLEIGDLFLGFIDTIHRSQLLCFHSVEPKLGIRLDVSSKNVQRTLKVGVSVCCDA